MTHLVVSHGLILVEEFETILVDRREMNKYIFGPIICSSHIQRLKVKECGYMYMWVVEWLSKSVECRLVHFFGKNRICWVGVQSQTKHSTHQE